MSSSSNPALDAETKTEVRPFPYAELSSPRGPGTSAAPAIRSALPGESGTATSGEGMNADTAVALAEHQQWEAQVRAGFDQRLQEIRESVKATLADFACERGKYFEQVEAEVVQLSLSIARRILRREAEIDPTLLAGMVRVALERIESGTRVTVRVHPEQVAECRAYFAQHMEGHQVPEVVEDPSLAPNHCTLETELGTTELGPEILLKEIEQGFLDLLARRPQAGK